MTIMYAKNYHNIPFLALGFAWKPSIQAFFVGKKSAERTTEQADEYSLDESSNSGKYYCDGRIYCSQMTSCEEAAFFLQNRFANLEIGNQSKVDVYWKNGIKQ